MGFGLGLMGFLLQETLNKTWIPDFAGMTREGTLVRSAENNTSVSFPRMRESRSRLNHRFLKELFAISLALVLCTFAFSIKAQTPKPFEMHGLRPGMLTREIILYSHAPLDTLLWGGEEGATVIGFKGRYFNDTGEFRVNVKGNEIVQVSFISIQRSVEQTEKAVTHEIAEIKKIAGAPEQDYHKVYRIITWSSGHEELKLTTADRGRFYNIALTAPQPLSVPEPDPHILGKPELKH